MHLERKTEEEVWKALMIETSHMPYRNRSELEKRGYEVEELED